MAPAPGAKWPFKNGGCLIDAELVRLKRDAVGNAQCSPFTLPFIGQVLCYVHVDGEYACAVIE